MIFRLKKDDFTFPDPSLAEEDGLLAIGGDLHPKRLLEAYSLGIFPWFDDDEWICWYAPKNRFVLDPTSLKISKSLRQFLRNTNLKITHNQAFTDVILACAAQKRKNQEGTWITGGMQQAYIHLHQMGVAHSFEVWDDELLVGGLYGIEVGQVFCGESMFSKVSNASKIALIHLCKTQPYTLIDCQVYTDHLASLGADYISSEVYRNYLEIS
jgi:leucyl/phenylalanyl-tRNA--protein transferase